MTWNDLECPIQLKVRMSHGLLADSVYYIGIVVQHAVFSEVHDQ